MARRLLDVAVAALVVVAAACGGSTDDDAAPPDPPTSTDAEPQLDPGTSAADRAGEVSADGAADGDPAAGTGDETDPAGDPTATEEPATSAETRRCDELLDLVEVAALFGEPAELDPALSQAEPELGALLCSWATVEDDRSGDTSSQGLSLKVYTGDPVAGVNFYDPTRESDAEPIEGLGDEAYLAHTTGIDTGVLDGESATLLSYFVVDLGDGSIEDRVSDDDVVSLLRAVHERAG
jgi:hypothetical protein